jgi:hypothetical protein
MPGQAYPGWGEPAYQPIPPEHGPVATVLLFPFLLLAFVLRWSVRILGVLALAAIVIYLVLFLTHSL